MKHKISERISAFLLLGLLALSAHGDLLKIPLGSQGASEQHGALPEHGMSSALVVERWGEPTTRHAAVGTPPIQRWEYPEFDVYFEYETVLHAVLHHRAQNLPDAPASDTPD